MNERQQTFQQRLSKELFKSGSSEFAALYLTEEYIENVSEIFPYLDPYIQGVLLQSVVFLKTFPPEEVQNSVIRKYYFHLIEMGKESSDDWVKSLAELYQNYPKINHPPLILENFHIEEEMASSDSYFEEDDSSSNDICPKGVIPPSLQLKDNEPKIVQNTPIAPPVFAVKSRTTFLIFTVFLGSALYFSISAKIEPYN